MSECRHSAIHNVAIQPFTMSPFSHSQCLKIAIQNNAQNTPQNDIKKTPKTDPKTDPKTAPIFECRHSAIRNVSKSPFAMSQNRHSECLKIAIQTLHPKSGVLPSVFNVLTPNV